MVGNRTVTRPSWQLLAGLAVLAAALAISRAVLTRSLVFDPAFISFRYARHLAFGHGLVWNPGERAVDGYGSLFLVLLVAPFVRAGADPLLVTRVLSELAALGLVFVVYRRARDRGVGRPSSLLLALVYALSNSAFALALAGDETILFSLALFASFHCGARYLEGRRQRDLALACVLACVAMALRWEALVLALALCAAAGLAGRRDGRFEAVLRVLALGLVLPLLLYVAFKLRYFGHVLPIPARAAAGVATRGEVVMSYFASVRVLVALALASIPLVTVGRGPRSIAAAFVVGDVLLHLGADRAFDLDGRFLFPCTPLLFELGTPALLGLVAWLGGIRPRWLGQSLLATGIVLAFVPLDAARTFARALQRDRDFPRWPESEAPQSGHSPRLLEVGRVLARYPGIEAVTAAGTELAALFYASDVRAVDLAGRHDPFIAREPSVARLTRYVFGKRPELLLIRRHADGSLVRDERGPLGDQRLWAEDPGWDDYEYTGTIVVIDGRAEDLELFIRRSAPAALREYCRRRVVDFARAEPPLYGSARAAERQRQVWSLPKNAPLASAERFPLVVSADRNHLLDHQGRPFMLRGDAAWSLGHALTREQTLEYFADRRQLGFNTVIVNVVDHLKGSEGMSNAYGAKPFLRAGDFTAPNEAYFEHLDWLLTTAREAGFLVLLTPAYLGYQGGDEGFYRVEVQNGPAKLERYGAYVGARWKDFDNVIWVAGGDFTPPDRDRQLVEALVRGIKAAGAPQLFTGHFELETSAGEIAGPWLDLDTTYTYQPAYLKLGRDRPVRLGVRPFVLIEGLYEHEHDVSEQVVRSQMYDAMLAGTSGHVFGSFPLWSFEKGWHDDLASPGANAMARAFALFESLPWWSFVPEPPGRCVVAGRGGFGSHDWARAARTADGRYLVVYLPAVRPITLDLGRLSVAARAYWFDPTSGEVKNAADGRLAHAGTRRFVPPGTNAEGAADWVLVLLPAE